MDKVLDMKIAALASLNLDVDHLGLQVTAEERPFVEKLVLEAGKGINKLIGNFIRL